MNLHLDQQFKPKAGREIQFDHFTFPGGEPHIRINTDFERKADIHITHRINSFNDLGTLCMAVDALRRMQVTIASLFIPYFPAARQDRVMQYGEPLAVKVYADIINAFQIPKVLVYDAHSDVTAAVLNNSEVISNHEFIKAVMDDIGNNIKLISPDGGALKKIYKLSQYLGGIEVVECSKSRDVKTGHLSGFKVYADDLNGVECLIVDDICDGGATFIGLAEALRNKNSGRIYLAVSHGIFSKGLHELKDCFEKIYTTDSIREIANEKVRQIKLTLK